MAGEQWYLAIGGQQVGPVGEDEVVRNMQAGTVDGNTLVFTGGMSDWKALKDVPQLAVRLGGGAPVASPVPSVPVKQAHEIEFKIYGNEMQFVEVMLDPGESAVAEAGGMMFMTPAIRMETIFGDGSAKPQGSGGLMGALLGAGKRLLTGESLFMTVFTNGGTRGVERVAFAAPYPGKILPMDLSKLGGHLVCQKD